MLAEEKKSLQDEQRRRNRIEGSFGVGGRHDGLGRVRTRLASTSESRICMASIAMNVTVYFAAYYVAKLNILRGLRRL